MLVFKESGRLGNQIFQYTALRSLCIKKEQLCLLGFSDLQATFNQIDAQIFSIDNSNLGKLIYSKLIPRSLNWLSNKGLITYISESYELDQHKLIEKKGFFNSIKYIEEAYFQDQSLFYPEVVTKLVFKPNLLSSIKYLLNTISASNTNIFVHIRRGDYLFWPSTDNPAVLSTSYYKKCIEIICAKISNPFFIFTSDDPNYIKEVFSDLNNSYISTNSSIEDFTLMSHCQGGILSASSFSWWAAYFSHLNNPNGIFLAPKYWIGHSLNSWCPPSLKSKFLTYVSYDSYAH